MVVYVMHQVVNMAKCFVKNFKTFLVSETFSRKKVLDEEKIVASRDINVTMLRSLYTLWMVNGNG